MPEAGGTNWREFCPQICLWIVRLCGGHRARVIKATDDKHSAISQQADGMTSLAGSLHWRRF